MSTLLKEKPKDETHIGDVVAMQPLSGTRIVTNIRVKGFMGNSYVQSDEHKKA